MKEEVEMNREQTENQKECGSTNYFVISLLSTQLSPSTSFILVSLPLSITSSSPHQKYVLFLTRANDWL